MHSYMHTRAHAHVHAPQVGIIYLEPATSVGTTAMVDSWLLTLPEPVRPHAPALKALFQGLLDEALDFHTRHLTEFVATVQPNLWRSVLNIIDGFLKVCLCVSLSLCECVCVCVCVCVIQTATQEELMSE